MSKLKILYGVCGIGMGHTIRQLPMIDYFANADHRLVIFGYGESLRFFARRFAGKKHVTVLPVSVPFFVGNHEGLDFKATLARYSNRAHDYLAYNLAAMAKAQELIGKADLAISDYEPVCAQFAYACGTPLVTIDQQSKYLVGDFPEQLRGNHYNDEVARLLMFFPLAAARLACSFFQVKHREGTTQNQVLIQPPILRESVLKLSRKVAEGRKSIIVYVSSQQDFVQDTAAVMAVLQAQQNVDFHVFTKNGIAWGGSREAADNVAFHMHGDSRFDELLAGCSGLITTGGHSLLSEAMHLGIPAYVVPLPVYEQQMNAHVLDVNGFGVSRSTVNESDLGEFLAKLGGYADAIKNDTTVLMRGSGEAAIIAYLEERFLATKTT